MGRITPETRRRNEDAIRAAMDRLLRGEIPPAGSCDIRTLAAEAGVPRTGFYPRRGAEGTSKPGPYQHLGAEFERRLAAAHASAGTVDPRDRQIERLKAENAQLRTRLRAKEAVLEQLTAFRDLAVSRLAAQHEEILQLRRRHSPISVEDSEHGNPGFLRGLSAAAHPAQHDAH